MFCCMTCLLTHQSPVPIPLVLATVEVKLSWLNAYMTPYNEAAILPKLQLILPTVTLITTVTSNATITPTLSASIFDNPISILAHDCATHSPSSIIIANGSISSTCYINCNPWFDYPVNEPTCHFSTYTQAQLLALIAQFLQKAAPSSTTNEDNRATDDLSPALLIHTSRPVA